MTKSSSGAARSASKTVFSSILLSGCLCAATLHAQDILAAPRAPLPGTSLAAASPLLEPISIGAATVPAWSSSDNSSAPDAANADLSSSLPPEAPDPQLTPENPSSHTDGQTKRILGIIPNFRSVSADQKLPPQTVHDKFSTAFQDSFDYSSIFVPSVVAFYNYERNATPEFGTGGLGYARYLWHSAADQTVENLMVEFFVPTVTHEDTRFYTLGHGGFVKRAGYSISRVVITRSDSGKEVFNASEVFGAGAAASISNLYYPSRERTFGNTADNWGVNLGVDGITFVFKEFWPDINHYLFHGKRPFTSSTASSASQ